MQKVRGGRKLWIGIGVAALIVLIAGLYWLFSAPSVSAAVLYVDNGTVAVDVGHGWERGEDEMELPQGAKIKVGPESSASVVLLEGEVMHLEPLTTVVLDTITDNRIHITQLSGETWNKVTKISGISTFEVETPTTVATVRGTEFFVSVGDEDDIVAVSEGDVDVSPANDTKDMQKIKPDQQMRHKKKTNQMVIEKFNNPALIQKFRAKYVKHLQQMRMRELRKNAKLMGLAKKRYGITDKDVTQHLKDLDEGKKDADAEYQQVPGMLKKKVARAYKLTQAIKKAKAQKP